MRKLENILANVSTKSIIGSVDIAIDAITFDSRSVKSSTLFVAIKGTEVDGHNYIQKAIDLGASVIVCEILPIDLNQEVTYIQVENSNEALAFLASNFYDNPSTKLKLVGVTGTNGKTTIATLLYNLFSQAGFQVGLLSTVKVMIGQENFPATHTTPDSISINKYLAQMVDTGCQYCFMEVSSHGIAQKRTAALDFNGGLFTNLSHDHLDYHKTFAEYRDVKKSFFDQLDKKAFAITNADDKNGEFMLQNCKANKLSYGLKNVADIHGQVLESQISGMLMRIQNNEIWVQLIGSFNASNLLAVYGAAINLGLSEEEVLLQLSTLKSVSGRFQYFVSDDKITAIVDYAHTPDALENVLKTIEEIRTRNEQLITVVGCGGNRDKTKRPEMGQIASEMSNQVIFTSDNPRNEDPMVILSEIEAGVEAQNVRKVLTIEDRAQAIKTACKLAKSGDIILIAGKGHEDYQEIKGVKYHFNDYELVQEFLKA
ncbi:UDP-N-acetylmuramoyl-L-alanyl-D-glutamate--2,6-diaminopimelate ligase [Paenimyroides tangerinum]|uniref:UDP-N-acetylmuramoyl-L-alanyl-D-glutamate--2,6-diaminopimelate ligase n=1 Tax=Paenimyroides tangerinum TaxID=2488728 RepID=A0A3P3WB61_9FLAO|nr:UDP-N-acetylmuramoyl-L-alanyl-D-glutamate--2,6-diaminopimelate ligase [Paenimyroides tangerinum]RRJ91894.1 UDP-N-acetylmuramoyl-L-alanyl-D-glutamate--2,6-diaminopimelate ligase [Paenimyroides tangerinum]